MKAHPEKLLWLDVYRLNEGKSQARTFLLEENVASVGYSMKDAQSRLSELYPGFCFYTRPTGGGVVFHGGDVCFGMSVAIEVGVNFRVMVYQLLGESLKEFFKTCLGFSCELGKSVERKGIMCSTMHAPGELLWSGKKFCGMAMRVMRNGFVLQGTVAVREEMQSEQSFVSISEIVGSRISRENMAGLLQKWLVTRTLPELQEKLIELLASHQVKKVDKKGKNDLILNGNVMKVGGLYVHDDGL